MFVSEGLFEFYTKLFVILKIMNREIIVVLNLYMKSSMSLLDKGVRVRFG